MYLKNKNICIFCKGKWYDNFRVKRGPMFLLPLHRKGGHFKLLTQWQDNCFVKIFI